MLSAKIDKRFDTYLGAVAHFILRRHVNPNLLTLIGLGINCIAGAAFILGYWRTAAVIVLLAGSFDMLDGAVARKFNLVTEFGEFLDSVVDRYTDTILLTSLSIYYARQGDVLHVALVGGVLVGTVLVPYVRAKAERYIPKCNVGLMERAERLLVLAVGAFLQLMPWALLILFVLTHITVLQRIRYTWQRLQPKEEPRKLGAAEESASDREAGEAKVLLLRRRGRMQP
ncbi:MAG: CDP-alcohol phosphatidyltransferase family protein [Candidatus Tectomicrobia bacterium]|nr:CDP-alcohol phosphatidyltransferase family protein [Candidatus Tectomicrobia bacterium]